ncbi:uncharacterized protein LOC142644511 [Castanea sativa]|uniref:uncharacterized protein LOC142644511 n=1 Tax=Castanea sativa TaxID=21020 RepID=UPI003F64D0A1
MPILERAPRVATFAAFGGGFGITVSIESLYLGWRACLDTLLTKANLRQRQIVQYDICNSCKMEPKSVGHIPWSYPKAQKAWGYSKMAGSLNLEVCRTFNDLLWTSLMVNKVGGDQAVKVVTIAWALWHNRNEVRHEGKNKNGKSLVQLALNYIAEYNATIDDVNESILKVAGIGVVIRDDKGKVEVALCKKIMALVGAVKAEAKAFEAKLLFAKEIGIQDIILEGDSLLVYNALCEKSLPPSSVEAVVSGMQEMDKEFRRIEFSHVRRQGNRPTHLLAKYASGINDYLAWIEKNPCLIEQTLIHDVISISHMQ